MSIRELVFMFAHAARSVYL